MGSKVVTIEYVACDNIIKVIKFTLFFISCMLESDVIGTDEACIPSRDAEVQSRTLVRTLNLQTEPKVQVQSGTGSVRGVMRQVGSYP